MQKLDCTTFPETPPPQLNARLLSSRHPPGYAGRGRVQLAHLCLYHTEISHHSFCQASSHLLLTVFPPQ